MKGQSEPINWILILVGGVVFLLFLIVIIKMLITSNQEKADVMSTTKLKLIIENSQGAPKTVSKAYLPDFEVACNGDYEITYKSNTLNFKQALFSSKKISGETIIWSEEFLFPYPTITLTYLVPKKSLIIFNSRTQNFKNLFPDEVTIRSSNDFSNEDLKGYDIVTFVSNRELIETVAREENQIIHGLKITEPNELKFYDYDNGFEEVGTSRYVQEGLLIGAILSNYEIYNCSLAKVDDKIDLLAEIHKKRIGNITTDVTECINEYGLYNTYFTNLITEDISGDADNDMLKEKSNIRILNNALVTKNCPTIY